MTTPSDDFDIEDFFRNLPTPGSDNYIDEISKLMARFGVDPNEIHRIFDDLHEQLSKSFADKDIPFRIYHPKTAATTITHNKPQNMPNNSRYDADIVLEKGKLYVTFEVPPAETDDIQINVTETHVTTTIQNEENHWTKTIRLPMRVKPHTKQQEINNNIVDLSAEVAE